MTKIWEATSRAPATGTERVPVDTSDSSGPGRLTVADILAYGQISKVSDATVVTSAAVGTAVAFKAATGGLSLEYCANGDLLLGYSAIGLRASAYGPYLMTFGGQTFLGCVTSKAFGVSGVDQCIELPYQYQQVGGRNCSAPIVTVTRDGTNLAGYDTNLMPGCGTGNAEGGRLGLWSQTSAGASGTTRSTAELAACTLDGGRFKIEKPLKDGGAAYQQNDLAVSSTSLTASDLSRSVVSGRVYRVEADISVSAGASQGANVGLSGPSMTSASVSGTAIDVATGATTAGLVTAMGSVVSRTGPTSMIVRLVGVVRPSASGTLAVTIAQASGGATAATLLANSSIRLTEMP